ncbi:MAG: hypothetical protein VX762_02395 [Bacteroidota bacterium]|nr:hypothetical protein [Bacteroidota bacterium]
MNVLDKIILIHPTKCAGTTISERLFKLKGFSNNDSAFYSGYSFNRFFQNNIRFFYFIFHSKNLVVYFIYLLFYCVCFYFTLRNLFNQNKYGLTFASGSIQHFTYKQWQKIKSIREDSICISVVTHPQHRMASSFYFLGYDKHYNFLEFLQKIQDGSLLSSIQFLGFRRIIKQHLISMYDSLTDDNGKNNIDFILKRESLNEDWEEFCAKYRLKHDPLKHINKTKSIADWKDLYRVYPEASQLVYNLYKDDFEHFGYTIITT